MKRACVLLLLAAGSAGQGGNDIAWRTDLDKARAEARRDDKPLLVVFR